MCVAWFPLRFLCVAWFTTARSNCTSAIPACQYRMQGSCKSKQLEEEDNHSLGSNSRVSGITCSRLQGRAQRPFES